MPSGSPIRGQWGPHRPAATGLPEGKVLAVLGTLGHRERGGEEGSGAEKDWGLGQSGAVSPSLPHEDISVEQPEGLAPEPRNEGARLGVQMGDLSEAPGPGCHHVQCGGAASPVGPGRPHALSGTSDTPQLRRGRASSRPAGSPAWLSSPILAPPFCSPSSQHTHLRHMATCRTHAPTHPTRHARLCHAAHALTLHTETHSSHVVSHTPLSQPYTLTRGLTPPHASLSHTTLTQTLTPTKLSYGPTLTPHPHTPSPPTVTHTTVARPILMVTHASHAHASLRHHLMCVCTTRTWSHSFLTHTLTHSLSPPPHPECEGVRSYTLVQAPACLGLFSL